MHVGQADVHLKATVNERMPLVANGFFSPFKHRQVCVKNADVFGTFDNRMVDNSYPIQSS